MTQNTISRLTFIKEKLLLRKNSLWYDCMYPLLIFSIKHTKSNKLNHILNWPYMVWSVLGDVSVFANLLTVTINIYFKGNIKNLLQSKTLHKETHVLVGTMFLTMS